MGDDENAGGWFLGCRVLEKKGQFLFEELVLRELLWPPQATKGGLKKMQGAERRNEGIMKALVVYLRGASS